MIDAFVEWLSETYEVLLLGGASVGAVLGTAWGTVATVGKKLIPIKEKVDSGLTQEQYANLDAKLNQIIQDNITKNEATLNTNTILSDEDKAKLEESVKKGKELLPTFIDNIKSVVSKY